MRPNDHAAVGAAECDVPRSERVPVMGFWGAARCSAQQWPRNREFAVLIAQRALLVRPEASVRASASADGQIPVQRHRAGCTARRPASERKRAVM